MSQFSQEYLSALAIVIVSLAAMFGYVVGTEQISALITVLLGTWVMIRRHKGGDIRVTGLKKEIVPTI